jgi:hypothetical protein
MMIESSTEHSGEAVDADTALEGAMKIIAVTNIKGGVGKTTTAVNLSYLCAAEGGATILWDLDPQGAATYTLKGEPTEPVSAKKLGAGNGTCPRWCCTRTTRSWICCRQTFLIGIWIFTWPSASSPWSACCE